MSCNAGGNELFDADFDAGGHLLSQVAKVYGLAITVFANKQNPSSSSGIYGDASHCRVRLSIGISGSEFFLNESSLAPTILPDHAGLGITPRLLPIDP
jgi:hypothetical protein